MGSGISTGLVGQEADFDEASIEDMDYEIRVKQVYTGALVWINFLLSLTSLFLSLAPGACMGGPLVTFGSMPHIVWQIPTLAVLMFANAALYFDSNANRVSTQRWLIVACWFVVSAAIVNVIHFVALCIEVADKSSTFYQQEGSAWAWVLFALTLVFILWQVWIAWRLYVLRADIANAGARGWTPCRAMEEMEEAERQEEGRAPASVQRRIPAATSSIGSVIQAAAVRVGGATRVKSKKG